MYSLIVVDDEDITRMAISGYLKKNQQDFKVQEIFSNASSAIGFLTQNPVDVVITDIRMPGMDGLDFSKYISQHFPNIIIMLISGYDEFEYARKAISYGVSTYLLKPLDFGELLDALGQVKNKLDSKYLDAEMPAESEDIQVFFTDLISGMLTDEEDMNRHFADLPLPGDPSDYKGCLLTVSSERKESLSHWSYGKEKLALALLGGIRTALPEYQSFHLFRSGMRYFFVILSREQPPAFSLELLENVLFHLLQITCKLNIMTSFEAIRELGTFRSQNDAEDTAKNKNTATSKASFENDDVIIQRAISYINTNYSEDLTRNDVARAVFLSSAYFSRFFKEKTGMNFIEYLTMVRMEKAAALLKTDMKVQDIAKKIGYQSHNRFIINFREYSGFNPTDYRKQLLKMENDNEQGQQ